jgi:HD-GYP domain-containing protein (c-di-GMP phosphodiesterase class II)
VGRYARWLADGVGLDARQRQRRRLALAARLHDVGKVAYPRRLLDKAGALAAGEYLWLQGHPVVGQRLLGASVSDAGLLAAVRGHHERYDGDGYPDGLRGARIPWLARILAVADCFDAMTARRPYRPALDPAAALDALRAAAGTQLDPEVVAVFVREADRGRRSGGAAGARPVPGGGRD